METGSLPRDTWIFFTAFKLNEPNAPEPAKAAPGLHS